VTTTTSGFGLDPEQIGGRIPTADRSGREGEAGGSRALAPARPALPLAPDGLTERIDANICGRHEENVVQLCAALPLEVAGAHSSTATHGGVEMLLNGHRRIYRTDAAIWTTSSRLRPKPENINT
jgi:hypothetical protein